MADTEAADPPPGEKEANKPPSPKPDTEDKPGEVAPPLVTSSKRKLHSAGKRSSA